MIKVCVGDMRSPHNELVQIIQINLATEKSNSKEKKINSMV